MESRSAVAPTTGGRLRLPVVSLPPKLHHDPIRPLVALLEAGLSPEQALPNESAGLQLLLHATELRRDKDDEAEASRLTRLAKCRHLPSRFNRQASKPTQAEMLAKEALRHQVAGHPYAPRSAIRVHPTLGGLTHAAQNLICQSEWFLDPSLAVVVAADKGEADETLAQLHQPAAHQGNQDDPFDSAQWVAEEQMPPFAGWKFDGPPPVRLASEIKSDEFWSEVFLAPRCRELLTQELLPAVRAARVGLHLVRHLQV